MQVQVMTRMYALLIGLSAALQMPPAGAAEPGIVYLNGVQPRSSFVIQDAGNRDGSLWTRELCRQALLIAAREEMGLRTFDVLLNGPLPTSAPPALEFISVPQSKPTIQLKRSKEAKPIAEWKPVPVRRNSPEYLRDLVKQTDDWSRNEFVRALETAGYKGQARPKPARSGDPLPDDLRERIDEQFSFDSQFLALRQLHELVMADGETRARLGGLVRAYTNLGVLTEHNVHSMSFAFKARGVLYAERWVSRDPKSALAVWHRAYANALVGMHASALEDLALAEKLATAATTKPEPPDWVPLLDAYCRFDFERLEEMRTKLPLAPFLEFLAYEQAGSKNLALSKGLELIQLVPDCYRVHDSLCEFSGVRAGHVTTSTAPMQLASTLLPRLHEAKELPAEAKTILDKCRAAGGFPNEERRFDMATELKARAKLAVALMAAKRGKAEVGDDDTELDEPAWNALGQMIVETTFLQTFRRAQFLRKKLGVPADSFIDAYDPLTKLHPYADFVRRFHSEGLPPDRFQVAATKLLEGDAHALQGWMTNDWPDQLQNKFRGNSANATAGLANEIALESRYKPNGYYRGEMLAVTPHSPSAKASEVLSGNLKPGADTKIWEEEAAQYPALARAFADKYREVGDLVKYEHFLKQAIKLDPSIDNYHALAAYYKSQKNDDLWLTTLEEFLKQPDFGLYHARIRVDISTYFAQRREWDKALPYSNAAAQTGAQWALLDAWRVNEANQNWEESETMVRLAIERYRGDPRWWYYWCRRTGQGDLEAARERLLPEGLDGLKPREGLDNTDICIIQMLEGHRAAALDRMAEEFHQTNNPWIGMQAALLADQLRDNKRRDALLTRIVEKGAAHHWGYLGQPTRVDTIAMAKMFLADLAAGGKAELDFDKLHAMRDASLGSEDCNVNYFLACYLNNRGKEKEAIEYWKQCMGSSNLTMFARVQAGQQLASRGIDPKEWKPLLFKPDNRVLPK
jgi:hypothetical protein